ncbi:MAG: VOC family protein [Promethearchaeota archaeon]|jgi:catechol 2,3-dioxygenase-like lactoylglutathione lyase family enzyme
MTVKFLDLMHIEITVPDAEKAYQILHNVFGAQKVQEEFAGFLDGETNRVIHVGLGDVVLQFIEPVAEGSSWDTQLKTKGSGVHNLTFWVENADESAREMEKLGGIKPLFTFDLEWGKMIPAQMLKTEVGRVYMMDGMKQFGFHLEFGNSPLKEEARNMFPKTRYETGRDELIGTVSPMMHIELVTPDIEKTYELLHKVFGSEKVEIDFANFLDAPNFMRTLHVNLSNVVLQYQQPLIELRDLPMGSWYDLLKKNGTYVHNITFIVNDLDDVVGKFKKEGIEPLFTFPLQWEKLNENIKSKIKPVHMMNTLDQLGFHMEFGEIPTEEERKAFSDLLYIDLD